MGGLAYKYIHDLSVSFKMVEHTYEVHIQLQRTLTLLKNAETDQRGFLITKDSVFLESYLLLRQALHHQVTQLEDFTSDSPEQQLKLEELRDRIDKRLSIFEKTMQIAEEGNLETPEFVTAFKEGRQVMNSIRYKVNEMINYENGLMKVRKEKSTKSLSNAPLLVYYVLILSLALLLLIYAQISKNLKSLRLNNEQLEIFKESAMQSEIVSKHGNFTYHIESGTFDFSDNLYRLLGEEPQSIESSLDMFMSYVHPEDAGKLRQQVALMIEEEDLPYIYYRIIQKNGAIRHFKGYAKVIINIEGDRRLLGTIADITDEIDNFRLIEQRNLELERNNAELASFNYVASHDLQEPLRKIQTFISRLEDKEYYRLSESGKLYIERIKTASSRMRSLIDDLLQFSRTNKLEEAFEVSNMNVLFETAKHDLTEIINEKKAKITVDVLPPMRVIPFQIKQLFQNLIGNSLKYSKDEVAPIIHIGYSKTKASLIPGIKTSNYKLYHVISVTDNGIGFSQEYAEKIFILFNRLHAKNEYSGTGIGLSICRKIVENHQGYLYATGKENKGATFTVYLPFN